MVTFQNDTPQVDNFKNMKTINFKELKVYKSFAKEAYDIMDIRKAFSDILYTQATGVMAHSLSLRIYENAGPIEVSDEESDWLMEASKALCVRAVSDAIKEQLNS